MMDRRIGKTLKDQKKSNDPTEKRWFVVLIFGQGFGRVQEMIDGIEFNPYFLGELVPDHACVFSCGVDAVQNGVTPLTREKKEGGGFFQFVLVKLFLSAKGQ